MTPLFEARKLSKRFGDAVVLEDVNLAFAPGRLAGIMGPNGAGQATKATNQILCAGAIQVAAEAMAFAQAEGLPLERVIEILGKGAGASWYFVHRAPFMARGEYPAGFRVRLHDKDLRICREMAARHGATLPVIEATLADYAKLLAAGHGDGHRYPLPDARVGAGHEDTPSRQAEGGEVAHLRSPIATASTSV